MSEGASFSLESHSPNHPLVLASRGTPGDSNPPTNNGQGAKGSTNQVRIDKNKAGAALDDLERDTSSSETIDVVTTLREMLSLN